MAALRDIASDVGVSVSLVSKVLNDRLGTSRVNDETIRRIHQAAGRLNYRKNMSAVALLEGRHGVIGVFIHRLGTVGSGIIEELLAGISNRARAYHQNLLLSFFDTAADFESLCAIAHGGRIDGLLVGGCYQRELSSRLGKVRKSGLPVVTIYDVPLQAAIPNVGISQPDVARLATAHLISRGSRRIAYVRILEARTPGYRLALKEAGLSVDPALVQGTDDFSYESGVVAVADLLKRGCRFDGLVAQSDNQAAGCMNALFAAGLRVPEDVRVIGIDNAPFCELTRVPLTSVSQDFRGRGETATRLLMHAIKGEPIQSTSVQPAVVARASTEASSALRR